MAELNQPAVGNDQQKDSQSKQPVWKGHTESYPKPVSKILVFTNCNQVTQKGLPGVRVCPRYTRTPRQWLWRRQPRDMPGCGWPWPKTNPIVTSKKVFLQEWFIDESCWAKVQRTAKSFAFRLIFVLAPTKDWFSFVTLDPEKIRQWPHLFEGSMDVHQKSTNHSACKTKHLGLSCNLGMSQNCGAKKYNYHESSWLINQLPCTGPIRTWPGIICCIWYLECSADLIVLKTVPSPEHPSQSCWRTCDLLCNQFIFIL